MILGRFGVVLSRSKREGSGDQLLATKLLLTLFWSSIPTEPQP